MECHPDNTRLDVLSKAISNMISQEFKSMRFDMQMEEIKKTETMINAMSHRRNITNMKMEFAKVQENMEDMVSKILAETKKVEIMNNAMQFEETSQPSVAESGINICFQETCSEKKVSQTKSSDAITSGVKEAIQRKLSR
ncbi:unnamed protein product [Clavelina lepadiformis]|uniref:Uncharacterized protein n=1 Tax=Clavelina lepadiformis TaxID=159417 RepID=A0ABP0GJ09_CLALP